MLDGEGRLLKELDITAKKSFGEGLRRPLIDVRPTTETNRKHTKKANRQYAQQLANRKVSQP